MLVIPSSPSITEQYSQPFSNHTQAFYLIPYRVVGGYHIYFFVKTNIENHKPYVIADCLAI
jgi:hypothetical protein